MSSSELKFFIDTFILEHPVLKTVLRIGRVYAR